MSSPLEYYKQGETWLHCMGTAAAPCVPTLRCPPPQVQSKEDDLLAAARLARSQLPASLDLCVHYSLGNNYQRGLEPSFERFAAFCRSLATLAADSSTNGGGGGSGSGSTSLLLISGSQRRRLDTVAALQLAAERQLWSELPAPLPLAVAFNPYVPYPEAAAEERERLAAKLAHPQVQAVYLQFGTDLERLEAGLGYLDQLMRQRRPGSSGGSDGTSLEAAAAGAPAAASAEEGAAVEAAHASARAGSNRPLEVIGSVLLPSRRFLASMRLRPWRGVFLSEEFLSGVEGAEACLRRLLAVYARRGVVPIIETKVQGEAELERVQALLAEAEAAAAAVRPGGS